MVCYIKFCGKYRIFERTNDRETIKDISQSYKTISSISIYFFNLYTLYVGLKFLFQSLL